MEDQGCHFNNKQANKTVCKCSRLYSMVPDFALRSSFRDGSNRCESTHEFTFAERRMAIVSFLTAGDVIFTSAGRPTRLELTVPQQRVSFPESDGTPRCSYS